MNNLKGKIAEWKEKNEAGSVTVFVLIAILFFIIVLMGVYTGLNARSSAQIKEINKIQAEYNVSEEDLEQAYEEEVGPLDIKIILTKKGTQELYNKERWYNGNDSFILNVVFSNESNNNTVMIGNKVYTQKQIDEAAKNNIALITDNCTIVARAEDIKKSYVVDRIDKDSPIVNYEDAKDYEISANDEIDINQKILSVTDSLSGIESIEYGFTNKNEAGTLPVKIQKHEIGTKGTKEIKNITVTESFGIGNYYLWTRVTDVAGNVAEYYSKVISIIESTVTYTNIINHWALGFKNQEGTNTAKTAYKLDTTTIKAEQESTFTLDESNTATVPNGYRKRDTFAYQLEDGTWKKDNPLGTLITQRAGSMKFECYYDPITYKITYDLAGGTNNSENPSTYNVLYGVTLKNPTKKGYTFAGWYNGTTKVSGINEGANATFTNVQDLYTKLESRQTGDIKLTAKWTINQYTLTVNPNGGKWNNTTTTSTIKQNYGSTKVIANPTPPTGYKVTFNGNGGSTPAAQNSTKSFTSWTNSGSGSLSGTTYTFGAGNGTLKANYKNNSITLPTATRTGYTFAGWYDAASGGNKIGNAGATYTPTSAKTLYAHWTINQYTLTVNPNGGKWNNTTTTSTIKQNYGSTKVIANPTPPTGYKVTFNGNGGSTPAAQNSTKSFTSWTNSGSGSLSGTTYTFGAGNGTLKANYKNNSITLPTATRTGYTFAGWYDAASGGNKIGNAGATYTPTSAKTLYAHWTVNTYTVTYNYSENGGTSATKTTASVKYGSAVDLTPTATKSGYTFVGWNTNKSATTKLSSLTVNGNITLYAIYKKTITLNAYTYNNKANTQSKTIYNKTTSASFTLPTLGNITANNVTYTPRGFSTSTGANATVAKSSGATITLSGNATYYANYQRTVTATFYYHGGTDQYASTQSTTTAKGTQYINYVGKIVNTNIAIPSAVTGSTKYYGANYKGVSTSAGGKTSVTPTTANTKYYAFYQVTVTFYYYNGSAHTSSTAIRYATTNGSSYSTSASTTPVPKAYDGAAWKGWTISSTNAGKDNQRTILNTANTVLYAFYQKGITITYNANGGTGAPGASAGTKTYISKSGGINTYNPSIKLSATKPTKTYYNFAGWGTNTSTVAYQPGGTYSFSASRTIYAVWKAKTITVTFKRATNSSDTATTTQTFTCGVANQKFKDTGWAVTGYNLTGWGFKADGSDGYNYPVDSPVTDGWINEHAPAVTLYARWKVKTLKVTFKRATNSSDTVTATQTFTYGVSGQKFNVAWSVQGYEMTGWGLKADGSDGAVYPLDSEVSNGWIDKHSPSITLYGRWKECSHNYNARGGILRDLGYNWTCDAGHTHDTGFYIYCSKCRKRRTTTPTLVCPWESGKYIVFPDL